MGKSIVLKIHKGDEVLSVKPIDQDRLTIGSSVSEVDIHLEGGVSEIHACVENRDGKYMICDLGSENGTFKNGDKILEAELREGDEVVIGDFMIEFTKEKASVIKAAQTVTPVAAVEPEPEPLSLASDDKTPPPKKRPRKTASASVGGAALSASTGHGHKTFAPPSPYKNINEFIRPTKGTLVEVLVCWRERVISAHHFSERGEITVGTHPSSDILVPLISTNVNKVPMIQIDSAAAIIVHQGLEGSLISDQGAFPFTDLGRKGRLNGNVVVLQQGEMARVSLGGELELVVRYASQSPKPLLIPFIDLSSNGFLAVLLAVIIAGILSLFVALSASDEVEKDDDEKYRTALIITNPPKPPPTVKKKKLPQKQKKKLVKKKIKLVEKKKKKKKLKINMSKSKKKKKSPSQKSARGIKRDRTAKALRKTKSKSRSKVGSVKKGGAIKTGKKKGAQMQSERKVEKSGLFGVFGTNGRNNRLDKEYGGAGELAGLADQATGSAGFNEDRAGKGLGSKFKETGGGKGKSNVGVTGIKGSGKGLGSGGGFGNVGLGDRKGVSIVPGGGGEEYSGQIDKEGIRQVFFRNQRAIRSCYERQLNRNPNLGGKLMLDFDIGEHGRVVGTPKIQWSSSTLKNRGVANCILLRLKTWRFPEPPRNNVVNVVYPLAFSAK